MSITISSSKKNLNRRFHCCALFLSFGFLSSICAAQGDLRQREPRDAYAAQRRVMLDRDLRGRGIKDARVLAAMEAVPRHLFVPEKLRASAYEDRPLPIGEGQTISQPYIVAYMTELLELRDNDKVLEIGTGSGYQAAVLARLAVAVYTIEIIPALGQRAAALLQQLGFTNIQVKIGDGFFGWEEKAPFDAILLTAASPRVPEPLWRQLREGGRLIMPLGEQREHQKLVRIRKVAGKQIVEELSGVVFVPLTGEIQRAR